MAAKMRDQVMDSRLADQSVDKRSAEPENGLSRTTSPKISRRTHQVKVLLNDEELEQLDWIVERMGSDRSSVMRYLLSNMPIANQSNAEGRKAYAETTEEPITQIRVGEIPDPGKINKPSIKLIEPRNFDQMPQVIKSLREGNAVIVNLTMMEPDAAQRSVDFVAGGTFYGDGHQERVGESIFLFVSSEYDVSILEVSTEMEGEDPEAIESSEDPKAIESSKEIPIGTDEENSLVDQIIDAKISEDGNDDRNIKEEEMAACDDTAMQIGQNIIADE
jgi:FtsZ-interacting cell division protein YlmF